MFLGIEIGGTKLQLGVGAGDGAALVECERLEVDPRAGATGILRQIERSASDLLNRHRITGIGCGFGGPVDAEAGRIIKSHQIEGWDRFELSAWLNRRFNLPTTIGNDCDVAGLAEARFGAGRGAGVVFYVTVGTGIGGGLILDGQIYRGFGPAAAEIGHLRPGLHADRPEETVESIASGWGIAAAAQARLSDPICHRLGPWITDQRPLHPEAVRERLIEFEEADEEQAADLLERCDGQLDQLSAKIVGQAAEDGNALAQEVLGHATQALGWGIAQVITLLSPQVVVLGGGLSQLADAWFLHPIRKQVQRYVFPPLLETYAIESSLFGETVVVQGAITLARQACLPTVNSK